MIKAREDEERVKNEAESYANGTSPRRGVALAYEEEAEAYRQQVIAKATGEAQRLISSSASTRSACGNPRTFYIDALESVLANTNKVMVDVEGGNVVPAIDKLAPTAASGAMGGGAMNRGLTCSN